MLTSIDDGIQDAEAGRMAAAEIDVDRAASMATAMRLESRATQADFLGRRSGSSTALSRLVPATRT